MNNNVKKSLEAALDAAAATGDKWLAGQAAFVTTANNRADIETALVAALDAAADEREPWLKGHDIFWAMYSESSESLFEQIKKKFSQTTQSAKNTPRNICDRGVI